MDIIKDLKLQNCCVKTIENINDIIKSGNAISSVLVVLPVFKAFFYPPGYSQLASLTSTVVSIKIEDWVLLARDVQMVSVIVRRRAYDISFAHSLEHVLDNRRRLQLFWEGVANAFSQ